MVVGGVSQMTTRTATCRCGQLQAKCTGKPVRVSACHCLECQKRSGSAFAVQARWADHNVEFKGEFHTWERIADSGHKATYQFCPICGVTLATEHPINPAALTYLNRLSDFLFVAGRWCNDQGAADVKWVPGANR